MANPSWFRNPLGITVGANNPTLSRPPPLTIAHGNDLGHRQLAPRDRSSPICRAVPRQRHRRRTAGPADQRRSQGNRRRVARPSQAAAGGDRGPRRGGRSSLPDASRRNPDASSGAPPADSDVRGPGGLDGAVRTARSRGDARCPEGLSEYRGGRDQPTGRLYRQADGRWRARLFRLAQDARGRGRARGSGRARSGSSGRQTAHGRRRAPVGSCRHRHRPCGRRRPRRRRGGTGAGGGGRYAEPCRTPPGRGRAWHGRDRRSDPPPARRSVRAARARSADLQGGPGTDTRLRGARRARAREPLRSQAGGRHGADRRPRSGTRLADRALAAGQVR